jgi:hypothetical protein
MSGMRRANDDYVGKTRKIGESCMIWRKLWKKKKKKL